MTMFNFDLIKDKLGDQRKEFFNAMKSGDEAAQESAFDSFLEGIQTAVVSEADKVFDKVGGKYQDENVLVSRGIMTPLTSTERKFFNQAVEKQSFDNLDQTFPETTVLEIFERLTETHELISRVDAQTTGALFKYIYADPTKQTAFWGTIPSNIRQILVDSLKVISFEHSKLSGFVPMTKGFFKLGPVWLANYVTTVMYEIMSTTLEIAIVKGTGKNQPIGITRKLSGSVDGVYPLKDKVALNDLKPTSLAGVRAAFAKEKLDNGEMSVVVHPVTYWSKLFPAMAYLTEEGKWVLTQLPTGETIVKSYAADEDEMAIGNLKNYLLAMADQVELNRYEETLAIEDMDLFVAKFYGTGLAKHPNAFFVYDVSGMTGATLPKLDDAAEIKRPDPTGLLNETAEEKAEEADGTETP